MRTITLLFCALTFAAQGCKGDSAGSAPAIPATHDPKGEDLVEGAVVAATESSGGIRLNKIIHVDDFPLPLDYEYHMIAYEPKAQTWEEAAKLWKEKKVNVVVKHFIVRKVNFMTRDYRVLFKEPLTPEEVDTYNKAKGTGVNMH